MKMWHVNNAGILLEIDQLFIGIDIFTEKEIKPYMFQNIYKLKTVMDNDLLSKIRLLLATHDHRDHFSPKETGSFLRSHPEAFFWGTQKTIDLLREHEHITSERFYTPDIDLKDSKIRCFTHTLQQKGIRIQRIPSAHMGKSHLQTEHDSILITWNQCHILISGDARPGASFYKSIKSYTDTIEILIAPFPFLGLKSARRYLSDYFSPQQIFLLHLPAPQWDTGEWLFNTKKICQTANDRLPDPIFCEKPGNCYTLI